MIIGIKTFVSNIFLGKDRSYIYMWISKSHRFIYVGQTNDRYGTWGRGFSHIRSQGTLRCRCEDRLGIYLDNVDDLTLFSYLLPMTSDYVNVESSFRLAVEYLVQMRLYEIKNSVAHNFSIISNVMTTDRTNNRTVKDLATFIVNDFIDRYAEL